MTIVTTLASGSRRKLTDVPPLLTVTIVVTLFVLAIAIERRAPRVVLSAIAALLMAFALMLQHVRWG